MANTKMLAYADFGDDDHRNYEGVRVTLADKIALERSQRANRWNAEDNPHTISAFLSWSAGKTNHRHDMPWNDFLSGVVDAGVTDPDNAATGDDLDPTQPEASTMPPSP